MSLQKPSATIPAVVFIKFRNAAAVAWSQLAIELSYFVVRCLRLGAHTVNTLYSGWKSIGETLVRMCVCPLAKWALPVGPR